MGALSDNWASKRDTRLGIPPPSRLSRDYYGGSDGANYRRQEEAYGRALRQLRYKARRGDTRSALNEIRVREEANERGFTPGGIRDRSQFNQERLDARDSRIEAGEAMGRANALDRGNINEGLGAIEELRRRREPKAGALEPSAGFEGRYGEDRDRNKAFRDRLKREEDLANPELDAGREEFDRETDPGLLNTIGRSVKRVLGQGRQYLKRI